MRTTKSADVNHGGAGRPITKASGSANITPGIDLNPTIADMKIAYPEDQAGTAMDLRGVTPGDPDREDPPMTKSVG